MRIKLWIIILGALTLSCGKKGFEGNLSIAPKKKDEKPQSANVELPSLDPGLKPKNPGNPNPEVFLCEDGRALLGLLEKPQFLEIFNLMCDEKSTQTTALYKELIAGAYTGTGEPQVKQLHFSSNDMFVTRMTIAFAMKAPLADPSQFYSLKAHDILATGIQEKNNEVVATVESRKNFPGRRSVEEVILNYSLNKSEGGGLHDLRRTAFNTYLLDENRTDVVLSTEELLDEATNRTYHSYRGMLFGVQADNGQTYLIFVNDLVIKNRIDPVRLQRTLVALNQGMQKKMLSFFQSKRPR